MAKAEEMLDEQERDEHCEAGRGIMPSPCKEEEEEEEEKDDDDDDYDDSRKNIKYIYV